MIKVLACVLSIIFCLIQCHANVYIVTTGQGVRLAGIIESFIKDSSAAHDTWECAHKLCPTVSDILLKNKSSNLVMDQFSLITLQMTIWDWLKEKHPQIVKKIDGCICQSAGAYSGLYITGMLSKEDTLRLILTRGRITDSHVKKLRRKFCMVVVKNANLSLLEQLSKESNIYVAGYNTDNCFTLVGTEEDIDNFIKSISNFDHKITCKKISVKAPFHSPYMKDMCPLLSKAINAMQMKAPSMVYISDANANKYYDADQIKSMLGSTQLIVPMQWSTKMKKILRDRDIVIIIGAGNSLAHMIKKNCPGVTSVVLTKPTDAMKLIEAINSTNK